MAQFKLESRRPFELVAGQFDFHSAQVRSEVAQGGASVRGTQVPMQVDGSHGGRQAQGSSGRLNHFAPAKSRQPTKAIAANEEQVIRSS